MARLSVVAVLKARSDAVEQVRAELLKLIAPTRKEAGCLDYFLHQDLEDASRFIFYETWESSESLAQHVASTHYQAYQQGVAGLIEEKTVHKLVRIS
jgi:quinol monooxygenase YgiN